MRKIYVLTLIMLASCASVGPNYDQSAASAIKSGMSEQEVFTLLGQPNLTSKNSNGIVFMQWTHAEAMAFGAASARSVAVMFDKSGKVISVTQSAINPS